MTVDACALCAAPTVPDLVATDRNRRLSAERFAYRRCTRCDTRQLAGPPEDLGRYYPPSYYRPPADRDALETRSIPERYKRDLVSRFVTGGRLVEVGPGVGGFLIVMQEAGFRCAAIEMDAACCRFLVDVVGVEADHSDDPAAALADRAPVDVVALWHVIEHVPDPAGVLAAAAHALAPGGIVILATPNPRSVQFGVLGPRWAHLDAPRHLFLIAPEELVRHVEALGLEVALLTTDDEGTRGWNLFGWRESLAGAARRPRTRAALRLVGSVLMRMAAPLERREGHGSAYTLVARRPG